LPPTLEQHVRAVFEEALASSNDMARQAKEAAESEHQAAREARREAGVDLDDADDDLDDDAYGNEYLALEAFTEIIENLGLGIIQSEVPITRSLLRSLFCCVS
jgi:ribosome recycling factor